MKKTLSSISVIAFLQAVLVGFATKLPKGVTQLSLDGVLMSLADIAARVQEYLGIYTVVPVNHGVWRNSIAVRREKAAEASKFIYALKAAIKGAVGKNNQDLLAFGIKPPKERTEPTEEQKLQRVQNAKATRAARHTLGKRQKARIHGVVPPQGNAMPENPPAGK